MLFTTDNFSPALPATNIEPSPALRNFCKRWGILDGDGEDTWAVMVVDPSKPYSDDSATNGNATVVSIYALAWLGRQTEERVPGVPELFKEMLSRHRTGITGGIGSKKYEFAKSALERVLTTFTPKQITRARKAVHKLAKKLVEQFPNASILNPPDQAATPEEIAAFWAQRGSRYEEKI